ncbi:MAG: hypothetical protein IJ641_07990 [Lachnospiraceae bacterium]|nr:hypothetical protein [Lachnospiraceae bacterium]
MRITESNVTMAAARTYHQSGTKAKSEINRSAFEDTKSAISYGGYDSSGMGTYGKNGYESLNGSDLYNNYSKLNIGMMNGTGSAFPTANGFQNNILSMLMGRFMGSGAFGGTTQQLVTYEEYENTQFHANGQAKTDDGRVIDFNVDIMMSRSYMEYMNIHIPAMQNALCDPLVVNIGTDTSSVRDQKFKFDIDADGEEDEISMLGRGSGFLALDKNDDGVINDGSELFGTKSGDGFADLREYDTDGNGWIDENDEIFSKLKVWCKGDNGEDILMNLKEADIGAIYLGSQDTEFTMSGNDGIRDGVVRSTGLFLRESSGAGTVQHVDMAIGAVSDETGAGQVSVQTITVSNIETSQRRNNNTSRAQAERRKALAKKRAEMRQNKKMLEQRRMDKKITEEKYEERLDNKRSEHRKRVHDRLEESILDQLFEDRYII